MPRGNPHPNVRGLGNTPVAWDDGQVTEFIYKRIKGERYRAPKGLPERPVLIRKAEVLRRTGLSYPTIWAMEKRGEFPPRVRLVPVTQEAETADAAE
jgi:predicted DNA-binding transcriptional regulator AlpA